MTDVTIRGLSLFQPWATLVANGTKRFETRSWQTNYRGWLCIHASQAMPPFARGAAAGFLPGEALPRGQIVAVAYLAECMSAGRWETSTLYDEAQLRYGHFGPGRYAWHLTDVRRLAEPVRSKGRQRLWRVPGDVVRQIVDQVPEVKAEHVAMVAAGMAEQAPQT